MRAIFCKIQPATWWTVCIPTDLPNTLSAPGVDAEKARIQDAYGGAARICDGVLVT